MATKNSKSPPVLMFSSLPKRSSLSAFQVYVNCPPESSEYAKTAYQWLVLKCRMLIFTENDILCSPVFRSESQLQIVTSKTFVSDGKLKDLLERQGLKENSCRMIELTDAVLQSCLSYSLLARVAPNWNQVGPYLVQGRDFLLETKTMSAVKLDILIQGDQLCMSICPMLVRLPHLQLTDFGLSPQMMSQFLSQRTKVVHSSAISSEWLYTLPGLRRSKILTLSHEIPPTCPFLNYRELKRHWKNMYGYRLPEMNPNSSCSPAGPYVTVTFKQKFSKADVGYTYPALCLRPFGPMLLSNVNETSIVRDFFVDVSVKLTKLCGINFELSLHLGRALTGFNPAVHKLLDFPTSQALEANVGAVSLNSLSKGWKPSIDTSFSQQQTGSPYQTVFTPPLTQHQPKSSQIGPPAKVKVETIEQVQAKNKRDGELMLYGGQDMKSQAVALACTSIKSEADVPSLAADVMGCASEPVQSAAEARAAKWAPKPLKQPDQVSLISEPTRPVYVPVFNKKIKTVGDNKKSSTAPKQTNPIVPSQVSKPFTAPQRYTSMCTNTTNLPLVQQPLPQESKSTELFKMTLVPRTPPVSILKKKKSMTPVIGGDTPSKKSRPSKPELSSEDIERLAKSRCLESVSVPQLVKWLKEHNVVCKARDKKVVLVSKVNEFFHL